MDKRISTHIGKMGLSAEKAFHFTEQQAGKMIFHKEAVLALFFDVEGVSDKARQQQKWSARYQVSAEMLLLPLVTTAQ